MVFKNFWLVSHVPKFGDASKSSAVDAASPARDLVASTICGICDTAETFYAYVIQTRKKSRIAYLPAGL